MTPTHPPTFLAEFMNPVSGEIEDTDVCALLSTALEKVYLHLRDHRKVVVNVEVSYDEDEEVEGVGFFDQEHHLVSCVTVYHLARDHEVPSMEKITQACLLGNPLFERQLNEIFGKIYQ